MEPIGPMRGATITDVAPAGGRARRDATGFAPPAERPAAAAAAALPLGALIAVQEAAAADRPGDRAARRRGRALLAELTGLQRDLLGPGVAPDRLERLRALAAGDLPGVHDPALAEALADVVLRARVELARFEGTFTIAG